MTDTVVTAAQLPDFRVGQVMGQAFSTFFGNFGKFFVLGTMLYLPLILLGSVTGLSMFGTADPSSPPNTSVFFIGFFLTIGVMLICVSLVFSAVTYGSIEFQAGKPVSFMAMLKKALQSVGPVLLASIMIMPLYMIGAMLLLIPGIIVLLMFSVTVPSIVAEGLGPMAAMRRSRELTSGYKWQIFGVLFLLGLTVNIAMAIIGFVFGAAMSGLEPSAFAIANVILSLILGGATYGIMGSGVASIYTSLRAAKEGTSVDQIAEVFA